MTKTDNQIRAQRFDDALTRDGTGSLDENLIDLLTDAMHWCNTSMFDFHHILAQACRHYVNELNDEQQDERRMCRGSTTQAKTPTREMPPHVFDALQNVVEHFYRDELTHYEAGGGEADHIFHALNCLKRWSATQQ
jgi:hypothetical protein